MVTESSAIRGRGRPRTFDRDHVIDVAMDCYWRDGTDGVSLNDLCRSAGVAKPGFYREFGGEDGLMDAVLERYARTVLKPMLDQTTRDRPFVETLATLVGAMTDPDRAQPLGCLLAKMRVLSSHLGPATQARVDTLRDDSRTTYARWVERAEERGDIATNVSVPIVAAFIDAQFTALLTQMALGEDPEMLRAHAELAFAGITGRTAAPAVTRPSAVRDHARHQSGMS